MFHFIVIKNNREKAYFKLAGKKSSLPSLFNSPSLPLGKIIKPSSFPREENQAFPPFFPLLPFFLPSYRPFSLQAFPPFTLTFSFFLFPFPFFPSLFPSSLHFSLPFSLLFSLTFSLPFPFPFPFPSSPLDILSSSRRPSLYPFLFPSSHSFPFSFPLPFYFPFPSIFPFPSYPLDFLPHQLDIIPPPQGGGNSQLYTPLVWSQSCSKWLIY